MTIFLTMALVVVLAIAVVACLIVVAMGAAIRDADAQIDRLHQTIRNQSAAHDETKRSFAAYRDAVNGLSDYSRQPWERN